MRLWLLRATGDTPSYDYYDAFVVRAETETEARALAQAKGGDEARDGDFWTDPAKSACEMMSMGGTAGIVIGSFNAG